MPEFCVKFLARPAAGRPLTWHEAHAQGLNSYGAVRVAVETFLTTRGHSYLLPALETLAQLRVVSSNTPRLPRYDGSNPVTHAQLAGHGTSRFTDQLVGQGLDYHEVLMDAWDLAVANTISDADRNALRAVLGSAHVTTYNGRPVSTGFLIRRANYNATYRMRSSYEVGTWPLRHRWTGTVFLYDSTIPQGTGTVEAVTEEQAARLLLHQAPLRYRSDRKNARVEFQTSTCPLARSYDRAYRDSYLADYRLTPEQLELQRARWDSLARARGPKNGDQPSPAQPTGTGDDDEPGSL